MASDSIEAVAAGWGALGPWIISVEERLESRLAASERALAEALKNQVSPAMQAEFELGKKQRDALRDALDTERAAHERTRAELERVEADRRSLLVQIQEQDRLYTADLATAQARVAELESTARHLQCESAWREGYDEGALDIHAVEVARDAAESAPASAREYLRVRTDEYHAALTVIEHIANGLNADTDLGLEARLFLQDRSIDTPTPAPSEPAAVTEARELLERCSFAGEELHCRRMAWLTAHPKPGEKS